MSNGFCVVNFGHSAPKELPIRARTTKAIVESMMNDVITSLESIAYIVLLICSISRANLCKQVVRRTVPVRTTETTVISSIFDMEREKEKADELSKSNKNR